MIVRSLTLSVLLVCTASSTYAQGGCPLPLDAAAVAAACDIEDLEGDLVKASGEDCNWIYMVPGDETRSLTVLRTATGEAGDAALMGQFAEALGAAGGGAQRALPDLADGGQASTQRVPMMGTSHTVSFSKGGLFIEVKAAGTPNMRGGDTAEPFCTLDEVEAVAREVASGL